MHVIGDVGLTTRADIDHFHCLAVMQTTLCIEVGVIATMRHFTSLHAFTHLYLFVGCGGVTAAM